MLVLLHHQVLGVCMLWLQQHMASVALTAMLTWSAGPQAVPASLRSAPGSGSALLTADYGSDEEQGVSIQGSAATPAQERDGSQSANGLPQGFFEVSAQASVAQSADASLLCAL